MLHFQRIASGINTMPVLHALQRKPHLWNQNTYRTTFTDTPHSQVDDILLRYSDVSKLNDTGDTSPIMGDTSSVWYPAWAELQELRPLISTLMAGVGAHSLDRLLISRLKPGCGILMHVDDTGPYVNDPERQRYHVALQGAPGSQYRCVDARADETVEMLTGEAWWFNPRVHHEVFNGSPVDRIHLLMDVRIFP